MYVDISYDVPISEGSIAPNSQEEQKEKGEDNPNVEVWKEL